MRREGYLLFKGPQGFPDSENVYARGSESNIEDTNTGEGSVFETTMESWWMSLELFFVSSFLMKRGLTIHILCRFCALVLGVHFRPNIHSKMTLRMKST